MHHLDGLWPIQTIKIIKKAIGIRRDAHHPLLHVALEHGIVANITASVGRDFFVRKDGAKTWAPVHRCISEIRQAICVDENMLLWRRQYRPCGTIVWRTSTGIKLRNQIFDAASAAKVSVVPRTVHLQEDPLCPLVERFVCCADTATWVVTQTKTTQLTTHVRHILFGVDAGVHTGGDGVLFGRKTKAVVAQCVKNVVALHALEASKHIGADVAKRVTHVEPGARWVGEHVEDKQFLAASDSLGFSHGASGVGGVIGAFALPGVLPACLNIGRQARRVSKCGEVCCRWGGGRRRITHGCAIV